MSGCGGRMEGSAVMQDSAANLPSGLPSTRWVPCHVMANVNTKTYWDDRFGSGDWEKNSGFQQTRGFAEAQVGRFGLARTFDGVLCDFGCGAGDAIPVYRGGFPQANLIGIDFSEDAIRIAQKRFGGIAHFISGDVAKVPVADVIVASNVMEHLSNDVEVVEQLLTKCALLHVTVPYQEDPPVGEHLNSYDQDSFSSLRPTKIQTFPSRGWSQFGLQLWKDVYLKNLVRPLLGKRRARRALQVMFTFRGELSAR